MGCIWNRKNRDNDGAYATMYPPVLFCAHFLDRRSLWPSLLQATFASHRTFPRAERNAKMKLKVVYENNAQYLEINDDEMAQLTVSLGINVSGATQEEKEQMVQEAFNVQFNRPDYNNWHKMERHWGNPETKGDSDEKDYNNGLGINDGYDQFAVEEKRWEEEEVREKVRTMLPLLQADAVIAVWLDGISITSYAAAQGVTKSAICQRLETAKKKLKNIF